MSTACVDAPCVAAKSFTEVTRNVLAMPFDVAREQYSRAVRMGLIERSMLASARYTRFLYAMEQLTLGPMARKY